VSARERILAGLNFSGLAFTNLPPTIINKLRRKVVITSHTVGLLLNSYPSDKL
jgi:hypothetical protein